MNGPNFYPDMAIKASPSGEVLLFGDVLAASRLVCWQVNLSQLEMELRFIRI